MRKIILSVAVSLDGFIQDANGEYDWCPAPSEKEMAAFLDRIDTIFMGRKSFESFEPKFFPAKNIVVFSNTLTNQKNITIVNQSFVSRIQSMKNEPGKDIWLYGGASLTTTFINEGLVDEMWLGLVPVLLGNGKPLFQNINQRKYFTLIKVSNSTGYLSLQLQKIAKKQFN
jgi:dihydrofolate reductase